MAITRSRIDAGRQPRRGITLVELMVGLAILILLIGVNWKVYRYVVHQGFRQDRQTAAWNTYTRAIQVLREDLAQAPQVRMPSPDRLELSTIQLGARLEHVTSTVVWRFASPSTLVREAPERTMAFDFGPFLDRGDRVLLQMRRAP